MIIPASDRALLFSFGETPSEAQRLQIQTLVHLLQKRKDLFLREIQPAYASVLVTFDPLHTNLKTLATQLQPIFSKAVKQSANLRPLSSRHIEIPVCYQPPFAPDLDYVANHAGLTIDEVIGLHSSAPYTVCFFGFMPGFSHWSGLPETLAVPRLASPRLKVPAGSVAIGGSQTGIYPRESPGGWRIIGRTPLTLFNPQKKSPCLLQLGDHVQLQPMSLREFQGAGGTWES